MLTDRTLETYLSPMLIESDDAFHEHRRMLFRIGVLRALLLTQGLRGPWSRDTVPEYAVRFLIVKDQGQPLVHIADIDCRPTSGCAHHQMPFLALGAMKHTPSATGHTETLDLRCNMLCCD